MRKGITTLKAIVSAIGLRDTRRYFGKNRSNSTGSLADAGKDCCNLLLAPTD